MDENEVFVLDARESSSHPLPRLNARKWAITFLIIGVMLTIVFGLTMPTFYLHAYGK
ncbi:hypothetical protein [Alicyclobacillus fastidiosus]|uniref:Uncharacterized protein n=1 Tax=Alicyclobacillus fastidiosus TaxID=392011 RepID=A0ABV5ACF3_9BACL|nr:hypothetical protein [Alicyclobacillus fastidiosus]WEH11921.1 hypothetical protein PYS47_12255 [Alicyclobacillus fastidiosus]